MTTNKEELPYPLTEDSAFCMKLEDHFAGLAMQGMMSMYMTPSPAEIKGIVQCAYSVAREMIKERSK